MSLPTLVGLTAPNSHICTHRARNSATPDPLCLGDHWRPLTRIFRSCSWRKKPASLRFFQTSEVGRIIVDIRTHTQRHLASRMPGELLLSQLKLNPTCQHPLVPSPSTPALSTPALTPTPRAGQGLLLGRRRLQPSKASQARTCLDPKVEKKLPSFRPLSQSSRLPGPHPGFSQIPLSPQGTVPGAQWRLHPGTCLRWGEACLLSSGSQASWVLPGSPWTPTPLQNAAPRAQ